MYALPIPQETNVGSLFGHFYPQTGLCVGMKFEGHTKWLLLTKKNVILMDIFSQPRLELNLDRSQWKSLIDESSMHVSDIQC